MIDSKLDVILEDGSPKIKWLTTYKGFKVWLVSGAAIRPRSQEDDEFGNWANHYTFPKLVPPSEIWISDEAEPGEIIFLVAAAATELLDRKAGKSADKAYDHAMRVERSLRERAHNVKKKPLGSNEKPPKKVYSGIYTRIPAAELTVYLINGEIVRDLYKTDFVEGGNGGVYHFVPNNELWIERTMAEAELIATTIHEFVEFTLMVKRHETYNTAHGLAAMVDWALRGKVSKDDIEMLTHDWALKKVDQMDTRGGKPKAR